MKVLITGGAGYIGAITTKYLESQGHQVTVFDHFQSHDPVKLGSTPYIKGDLLLPSDLQSALSRVKPDAVIHFAAYIQMGESVENPRKYYENNVLGSYNLANACVEAGVDKIVFSSSAGVYGNLSPAEALAKEGQYLIPEDTPKLPTNPYGESKLAVERLLGWYEKPYGLRSICIRYFNAAGADNEHGLGEDHHDESHIIPNIIKAAMNDQEFSLMGTDYPTPDGTCVRDYIHVLDLASAHLKAVEALVAGAGSTAYNAGTGHGYSNREIIGMVEKVSSKKILVKELPRRPGDAGELVADVTRIQAELGWSPDHSDLESIIKSAYNWHKKTVYGDN